jgi:phage-related protein
VDIKRPEQKPCIFIGSSLKDLKRFPAKVKNRIGFALNGVQEGGEPAAAKALRGFSGRAVLELPERYTCCTLSKRRQKGVSPRRSQTSN